MSLNVVKRSLQYLLVKSATRNPIEQVKPTTYKTENMTISISLSFHLFVFVGLFFFFCFFCLFVLSVFVTWNKATFLQECSMKSKENWKPHRNEERPRIKNEEWWRLLKIGDRERYMKMSMFSCFRHL